MYKTEFPLGVAKDIFRVLIEYEKYQPAVDALRELLLTIEDTENKAALEDIYRMRTDSRQ